MSIKKYFFFWLIANLFIPDTFLDGKLVDKREIQCYTGRVCRKFGNSMEQVSATGAEASGIWRKQKKGWSVMIRIFTDTAANLPSEILQSHGIGFVPLSYSVNGESAVQTAMKDFDGKTFYGAMRNGAEVQTSMANMSIFLDPFCRALERGEDVLYIGISGGISGTSHAACLAAEELKKQYPDRKIVTINSLAASLCEGL